MSAKSAASKLRIEPKTTIWSSHPDRLAIVGNLPEGVRPAAGPEEADTAVVFGDDGKSVREIVAREGDALNRSERLWVAYPKGNRSDINRDTLWPILAEFGMRPAGQVALDDTWSAMRFRPLQPGEVFEGGNNGGS